PSPRGAAAGLRLRARLRRRLLPLPARHVGETRARLRYLPRPPERRADRGSVASDRRCAARSGGAARRRAVITLAQLRAAGVLSPLDEQFALTLARLADERDPSIVLAAALASRQVGLGHTCLDLRRLVHERTLVA